MLAIRTVRELTGKPVGFCVVGPDGKTFHATMFQAIKAYDKRRNK